MTAIKINTAQEFIRRSVTTEARVGSHISPRGVRGGRIGTGTGFLGIFRKYLLKFIPPKPNSSPTLHSLSNSHCRAINNACKDGSKYGCGCGVGGDKKNERKGKEKGPTHPNCVCKPDTRRTIIYLYSFDAILTTMRIQAKQSGLPYLKNISCKWGVLSWWRQDSHALPAPYASQLLRGYRPREKAIKFEWRNIHPVSETYCMHPIRKQGHALRRFRLHTTLKYTTYEDRQNGRAVYYSFCCSPAFC